MRKIESKNEKRVGGKWSDIDDIREEVTRNHWNWKSFLISTILSLCTILGVALGKINLLCIILRDIGSKCFLFFGSLCLRIS